MKETLRTRAATAVDMMQKLDGLFKNDVRQNAIAIVMLAIEDSYRQGKKDALTPPIVKDKS